MRSTESRTVWFDWAISGVWLWWIFGCVYSGDFGDQIRLRCKISFDSIEDAVEHYKADHGVLPPFLHDDPGSPLTSCMTYLLPYLGFSDEYHMYDFGEEWSSERNLAVASKLGDKLNCKFDPSRDRSYFLLGEISEHIDPLEAGRVVEIHESEVQLLEPVPQKAKKALMVKYRQNADLHKSKN